MKSSAKKIELASVDDLFSTEEGRQDAKLEKIQEIPLSELHPFRNHPFKVKDDEAMMETADSIKQYGVLVPAIARPDPEGGYELVAGHRRHRASELAEKETMPVIVRDLDDDAATIIMVDSNLQRESLLPSERAFAYKMKLDAIKHQGARTDLTSAQVGPKLTAAEKIAENSPDSKSQIKRFIRLLANRYQFTISERSIQNLEAAMADSDNLTQFMQAQAYVRFRPDSEERSTYLYRAYTKWCEDNLESPVPQKKFSQFLLKNAGKYGLTFSKHIEGKYRGFRGVCVHPAFAAA